MSTHPHLNHLDTDVIADLIENLLPAPEAHQAREHVKACPDCQRTYDALLQLTEDLAEEGRADIPMPADVAEHLDAVIVSESAVRASTIGVHSLAQIREQPKRHLPRLLSVAAGVLAIAAAGVGVVIATADHSKDGTAGIDPTDQPTVVATLAMSEVGPEVQRLLEGRGGGSVLRGAPPELACAQAFAEGQPNPTVRLVQPAEVSGERVTVLALQGASARELRVYVVTGCDPSAADPSRAVTRYQTSVTLRSR